MNCLLLANITIEFKPSYTDSGLLQFTRDFKRLPELSFCISKYFWGVHNQGEAAQTKKPAGKPVTNGPKTILFE